MAKQIQTDNDAAMFDIKIQLRERLIQEKQSYRILEAFAGDGALWQEIKRRHPEKNLQILRIDAKPDKKGVYLKGENTKFMASMDLAAFDIIDLDAYGSPFDQLELVFRSKFTGPVVCTFIQTMTGRLNTGFLEKLGYSSAMVKKCPSLFNSNGLAKMKAYLALQGVDKMLVFSQKRKNYFSFFRKKEV
jgi:hypothetical protein